MWIVVGAPPGLVADGHAAIRQRELAVLDPPQQRRHGAALGDGRLPAQAAGRLAGGRRADHLVAAGLEGGGDHAQGRGLSRPGDADDELGARPEWPWPAWRRAGRR